jgi:hypothetical protein
MSLGQVIAQLDVGLEGLDHPAARRELKWDLVRAGWIREHLTRVGDPVRRALVARVLERFDREVVPLLSELRAGIIYNDANDYNLLVRGMPGPGALRGPSTSVTWSTVPRCATSRSPPPTPPWANPILARPWHGSPLAITRYGR